jgi:alkylhydroperoxidase/carboxymuconolactone decarboxylase family protein YurZ
MQPTLKTRLARSTVFAFGRRRIFFGITFGLGSKTMNDQPGLISNAFQTFMTEAPDHAQAWGLLVRGLGEASALDEKTGALAYLAVLAALGLESGVPFHVQSAKQAGASRDEVISAILIGLPAAGHRVTQVLPAALATYNGD